MTSPPSSWSQLEAHLDEAVAALPAHDRHAILLRYFENKSLREIGAALGTSDDAAMLARYSIFHDGPTATTRDAWIIRETTAVDTDYDSRHHVDTSGGYGSSSGLSAWQADLAPRLLRAREAFLAAHPGSEPTSLAQVVPFIDPPLPPATLEKILAAERARSK